MFIINSLASYFVLYKNERNYILQDIINTEISMIIWYQITYKISAYHH
jgi:hypothetical protein